jgi:hypothetical protein
MGSMSINVRISIFPGTHVKHSYAIQQAENSVFGFRMISIPVGIDVNLFSYALLTMESFKNKTEKNVALQNPILCFC